MKSNNSQKSLNHLQPRFGSSFLEDHARRIISDAKIALIELVANCWDAGADRVDITLSEINPDKIAIEDNGVGMTLEEFSERWTQFNYNRKNAQGLDVIIPSGNKYSNRKAFGRNGKGRHSMFCFCDEYIVETWKDGEANKFQVKRLSGISTKPFDIIPIGRYAKLGHGTLISATLIKNEIKVETVHDLLGSKFITDPSFRVYINGNPVKLTDLGHLTDSTELSIPEYGLVTVRLIDSLTSGRTSQQNGVAWWVNKRLVGEVSWKGFGDYAYLDARRTAARRYTFIVEADILDDDVEEDWNSFKETLRYKVVHEKVEDYVLSRLSELLKSVHKAIKIETLKEHHNELRSLSNVSRRHVGQFIDEIQNKLYVPQKVLSATISVLVNIEKARSGYMLLEQLASLKPNEIDKLNDILTKWSVEEATLVLDELERRLNLIAKLRKKVEDPLCNELQELQPLFEQGLWIFGPEYESPQFQSNHNLSNVIKNLLKAKIVDNPALRKRPDFVVLPDSSIGVYAHENYDERGEVDGIGKVLIIELKRGGFNLTREEGRQPLEYANIIRNSGKIRIDAQVIGFVLGATIERDAIGPFRDEQPPQITIYPRTYSTVLLQAHARTFNLSNRIRDLKKIEQSDPDVEEVLGIPEQSEMTLGG